MKLFINARFLSQPISGVQRYGIECSLQIKRLYPSAIFLTPCNVLHKEMAKQIGAIIIGKNTGHLWEQIDLPLYLAAHKSPPLLSLANTAPLFYNNNFVTIHDLAFLHHPEWNSKTFSAFYNFLIPRIAKKSKHIFTVSNIIKQELVKHYKLPASKISVTYNGIGAQLLAEDTSAPPVKQKIILAVGTFSIRKNHQNLVKAYTLSNLKNDYQLIIIGDKHKVFAESGIDEHALQQYNIKIMQRLTDAELKQMYQRAEILVSISGYEGFGIPVLEGIFFNCNIICSDIPVYRELFAGAVNFCDPGSITDIADSLNQIAGKPGIIDSENRNLLLQKYNYERAAHIILGSIIENT
ncbi:MAG: glycosyltransferase family 4 protein [Taibaiella sp.]|nr:glycosyltransferase family 4 protein [Taibaiella sp.]